MKRAGFAVRLVMTPIMLTHLTYCFSSQLQPPPLGSNPNEARMLGYWRDGDSDS